MFVSMVLTPRKLRTRNKREKKYGLMAKDRVLELLANAGNEVVIHTMKEGKYGRMLADFYLPGYIVGKRKNFVEDFD